MKNKQYNLIDCHVHLTNNTFMKDIDYYLNLSLKSGVHGFVNSGFKQFLDKRPRVSEQKSFVKTSVGISHLFANAQYFYDKYKITLEEGLKLVSACTSLPDVIAIGELGLEVEDHSLQLKKRLKKYQIVSSEHSYTLPALDEQIYIFNHQLQIAQQVNLPVVIHCENANDVLLSLLQNYNKGQIRGMIHGFHGDLHTAQKYREKGMFLSLNYSILYPENIKALHVVKEMGLTHFVLESDAPGFPPVGNKKRSMNTPDTLPRFAELLREELNMSKDDFYDTLTKNVDQLFRVNFNEQVSSKFYCSNTR